jgi:hypothetical protein
MVVRRLWQNVWRNAGEHELRYSKIGSGLPSGRYVYRIEARDEANLGTMHQSGEFLLQP